MSSSSDSFRLRPRKKMACSLLSFFFHLPRRKTLLPCRRVMTPISTLEIQSSVPPLHGCNRAARKFPLQMFKRRLCISRRRFPPSSSDSFLFFISATSFRKRRRSHTSHAATEAASRKRWIIGRLIGRKEEEKNIYCIILIDSRAKRYISLDRGSSILGRRVGCTWKKKKKNAGRDCDSACYCCEEGSSSSGSSYNKDRDSWVSCRHIAQLVFTQQRLLYILIYLLLLVSSVYIVSISLSFMAHNVYFDIQLSPLSLRYSHLT